ncbi:hypothetical protein [Candidatus Solirubrobacter pratensis]|uniref:hypothetical protein n=1 Tax=Candidatus Solirubrobacter pratensis TaxID=1298857 RepID=UPI000421F54B|nr:hypothetical protein [Candidatus Solirubrobacter pratensis]
MRLGPARLALADAVEQVLAAAEVADDRAGRPGSGRSAAPVVLDRPVRDWRAIRRLVRKLNADRRFRAALSGTLSEQHV